MSEEFFNHHRPLNQSLKLNKNPFLTKITAEHTQRHKMYEDRGKSTTAAKAKVKAKKAAGKNVPKPPASNPNYKEPSKQ